MLHKTELEIVHSYARGAIKSSAFVAGWNDVEKRLTTSVRTKRKILNLLCLCCGIYCTIAGTYRLISLSVYRTGNFGMPFLLVYAFIEICYLLVAALILGFGLIRSDMVVLYNQLASLYERIYSHRDRDPDRRREKLYQIATSLSLLAGASGTVIVFCAEAYYSWITTSCLLAALLSGLVHASFTVQGVALYGLASTYLYLYFIILQEHLQGSRTCGTTLSIHCLRQFTLKYRSLTILCTFYNATYCKYVVPAVKLVTAMLWMICASASVRIRATQGIGAYAFAPAVFLCGFNAFAVLIAASNMMSSIWDMSLSFLREFRNQAAKTNGRSRRKYIRVSSASFLPLRFAVGIFYYMEREAKLTLISFLTVGAANLLIASNADRRFH